MNQSKKRIRNNKQNRATVIDAALLIVRSFESKFRKIKTLHFLINLSFALVFLIFILFLLKITAEYQVITLLLFSSVLIYAHFNSKNYRSIGLNHVLEHLNRNFHQYEESAQLLLLVDKNLNHVQHVQINIIAQRIIDDSNKNRLAKACPKFNYRIILLLSIVALSFLTVYLFMPSHFLPPNSKLIEQSALKPSLKILEKNTVAELISAEVIISPPDYTGIKPSVSSQLDLTVPQGSHLKWKINFSQKNFHYYYIKSNEPAKSFIKSNQLFSVNDSIEQTNLYQLTYQQKNKLANKTTRLGSIHSIQVILDQRPKIKFIQPTRQLTEIRGHHQDEFLLTVEISDDYGISDIKILASVAKGDGEAVKFRDKIFRFSDENYGKKSIYQKKWKLKELDMEPGDEVYFQLLVSDNKQPIAQLTKSSNIIVRWNEQRLTESNDDKIKINFIAEYFRSQRQIIIETEQLIDAKNNLSLEQFKKTSIELGHSQRQLKDKYSQFFGDRIDQVSSELGKASIPNPKQWVKKAIAEMWQADINLMMSEPKKALPFEYKAYQYLKLAQQADRIYLKRLGFQPPPVSEKSRLTGELKDVLEYERRYIDKAVVNLNTDLYKELYQLLSEQLIVNQSSVIAKDKISAVKASRFTRLSSQLLEFSQIQPELLKYANIAQQIAVNQSLALTDCAFCALELKQKLWQMLPEVVGSSNLSIKPYAISPKTEKKYLAKINEIGIKND